MDGLLGAVVASSRRGVHLPPPGQPAVPNWSFGQAGRGNGGPIPVLACNASSATEKRRLHTCSCLQGFLCDGGTTAPYLFLLAKCFFLRQPFSSTFNCDKPSLGFFNLSPRANFLNCCYTIELHLYYFALILYSPSISRPSSSPLPSLQPLVSVTEIEH